MPHAAHSHESTQFTRKAFGAEVLDWVLACAKNEECRPRARRAREYFQAGRVKVVSETTETVHEIQATVRGSKTYPVTLTVTPEMAFQGSCECHDAHHNHICKHMLAVAIDWAGILTQEPQEVAAQMGEAFGEPQESPSRARIERATPVAAMLKSLSEEDLARLIVTWEDAGVILRRRVDEWACIKQSPKSPELAEIVTRSAFGVREYMDAAATAQFVRQVRPILGMLEVLRETDPAGAFERAARAMRLAYAAMEAVDDSWGTMRKLYADLVSETAASVASSSLEPFDLGRSVAALVREAEHWDFERSGLVEALSADALKAYKRRNGDEYDQTLELDEDE